ncbi:MAG TPA: hypothetical protein VK442_08165 [Xanthobacteraceae bacterium]|nr:hypothetical protein [Xanthobacteraceae bacterium]
MTRTFTGRYWVAVVLSVAWIAGATVVLNHQRTVEVHKQMQVCHQLQDDARLNKACAEPNAVSDQQLCRFKDADCDRWPLEEERYLKNIASVAVAPVAIAWLIFYGVVRVFRRARRAAARS